MPEPTILYMARHGQTDWNLKGITQGHKNSHLTELGIQQANDLADTLKEVPFSAVYSSDLDRARQTAEIVALPHKLDVQTTTALRERTFGQAEGLQKDKLKEEYGELWDAYEDMADEERYSATWVEGMESDKDLIDRLTPCLEQIAADHQGETVLLVCHGNLIKTFLVSIGYATHREMNSGSMSNCGFVKLSYDGEKYEVLETSGINRAERPSVPSEV